MKWQDDDEVSLDGELYQDPSLEREGKAVSGRPDESFVEAPDELVSACRRLFAQRYARFKRLMR